MARISRKQLKQDEFVDAAGNVGHWLEHNWGLVVKGAIAALVVALGALGWIAYSRSQRGAAEQSLGRALASYQQIQDGGFTDSAALERVLVEFKDVEDRAGRSPSGQVARFYRGTTLYRLGRADEAIAPLKEVSEASGVPPTLAGAANAMLAEVHASAGQTDQAIALLQKLSEPTNTSYPPEEALLKLGWVHANAGNMGEARRIWQSLLDQYPQSGAAQEVTKVLGPQGAPAGGAAGAASPPAG